MAAPMLVPLILLGGATIALAAASSKKKAAQPPLGTGKTYTLDANMPAPLRDQVLAALATEQDPQKLEAFASAIELQYPGAAAALRMKETVLRAQVPSVSPSQAPPRTSPVPHLPVDPGPLPSLPIPIDPGLLSIPSVPLPVPAAPAPTPAVPAVPAPAPLPLPIPAAAPAAIPPLLGGLDPGMPIEVQRAVVGALTTESDPAKLEGFASAIQAQYPVAAGLLMAKAQALRLTRPAVPAAPAPAPGPVSPSFPIPPAGVLPPPAVPVSPPPGVLPSIPVATGGTYTVLSGDFPIKIAKKLTGDPNRWHELIAANPNKRTGKDGNFVSLLPGEVLKLPLSWASPASPALPAAPSAGPALPAIPGLPSLPNNAFPLPSAPPGFPLPVPAPIPGVPAVFHPPTVTADSYTVQGGDSPIKIARKLTGDGNRWHELIAANPSKKTGKDGNFVSLLPGEILHLPSSWVTTGSTDAPVLAAAHGGSNVAHA